MTSVSTFLTFSEGERVLDEWEFLSDPGAMDARDLLKILIFGGGAAALFASGREEVYVFGGILAAVLLLTLWGILVRPDTKGYICLTNWRFLYYERGAGSRVKRRHHYVASANLEDVLGIYSVYHQAMFGVKNVNLTVHTRYEDGVSVRIGTSGGLLSKIPGIGRIFLRTTIGKDAYKVLPVLFRLIQERQGSLADRSSGY